MGLLPTGVYRATVQYAELHTKLDREYIKFELDLGGGSHIWYIGVVGTPSYDFAVAALGLEGFATTGPGTVAVLAQGKKVRAYVLVRNTPERDPTNVVAHLRKEEINDS